MSSYIMFTFIFLSGNSISPTENPTKCVLLFRIKMRYVTLLQFVQKCLVLFESWLLVTDLIRLAGVCLWRLIRFDWGGCSLLRTSQPLTWGHAPPHTGTGKPRRSQHFPARVEQLSSPGPAPGQSSSTKLRRKFPFLSPGCCSESRV